MTTLNTEVHLKKWMVVILGATLGTASGSRGLSSFPGASGYGAVSLGGRSGKVIAVTSLADSGPGTLREALGLPYPRQIVFRTSGVIELKTYIDVVHPFVTVSGQTAPGNGITIRMAIGGRGPLIRIATHDVILRYLRLRRGNTGFPGDNLAISEGAGRVLVDHLSITWSTDENFEIYSSSGKAIQDVTIQNSIIAQPLAEARPKYPEGHPLGALIGAEYRHWGSRPVSRVSLNHNLFAHNTHRNPRLIAEHVRIIGNLIYNWHSRAADTIAYSSVDWIGNRFLPGPLSNPQRIILHESTDVSGTLFPWSPSFFFEANSVSGKSMAGSELVREHYDPTKSALSPSVYRSAPLTSDPFPPTPSVVDVLAESGARRRLDCGGKWMPALSEIDSKILEDVRKKAGPISIAQIPKNSSELGGYPAEKSEGACLDSDADGMPDDFEKQTGTDSRVFDSARIDPKTGYTMLERYLNGRD